MVRTVPAALTALLLALSAVRAADPPVGVWEREIAAYEAADRRTPPPAKPIVFVGSSSVRLWTTLAADFPQYPVLNRGFGGCYLSDCVTYADRIVTNYRPRLIVVHAGTNDIAGGRSPRQVFNAFVAFVAKVRTSLPDVPIVFSCLNPAPVRVAQMPKVRQANRLIRDYIAGGHNLDYIDAFDCFLGPDGLPREELYRADRLHNNAAGYKIRAALTLPHLAQPASADHPLYLDPTIPVDRRVNDLMARLTLEEKAQILDHKAPPLERLGMPFWAGWNQCLHGVWSKTPTTCYPTPIALAATWDPELLGAVADAVSDEARALYNLAAAGPETRHGLVYRAPVINICRDPRWGRIQESYGEDPYLTSRLAVAFVEGLQGHDPHYLKLAATLKHYAVNNQESGRQSLSATVSERMLHEYWLPHFRAAVTEGHASSLMAAYNAVNGTPCCLNHLLLTDILRDQWGFEGFVVSDLGGIGAMMAGHQTVTDPAAAVATAVQAGCDYDDDQFRRFLPAAVAAGLLPESAVTAAAGRVLRTAFALGVFDPPGALPWSKLGAESIDSAAHRELARRAEREAIVLLKNDGGLLPLAAGDLTSVALIGPAAETPCYGNYFGASAPRLSPADGLRAKLPGAAITVVPGCGWTRPGDRDAAVAAAKAAQVAIVCLGTDGSIENEGRDRVELSLPACQENLLRAVAAVNARTVLVLFTAGPPAIGWAAEHVPAIVQAWYPGEEGGSALAEILLGEANPAGRLPYTVYRQTADLPPMSEYDVTKGFTYLYFGGQPLFGFGHGLSYTRFEYGDLKVEPAVIGPRGTVTVNLDVTDAGARDGDEVAQLYLHQRASAVTRPRLELRGLKRLHLAAGAKNAVSFELRGDQLGWWDETRHGWQVEDGTYDVLVGASSSDIRTRGTFEVQSPKGKP